MSGRSKGFDPLSNLFDAPAPAAAVRPEADAPAEPEVDKVALARKLAAEAQAKAAAQQAEKVALAKKLAAQAQAKADAEHAEKVALAKRLAAEAQAKAAARSKDDTDKAALAKALAKAAMEKNKAAAPKKAKASLADRAPRSLADRAGKRRPMSALEAARAAASAEAERKKAAKQAKAAAEVAKKSAIAKKAQASSGGLVSKVLGSGVVAQPARLADQRDLLTALWKSHAQRHVEDQNWAVAGACSAVVEALGRVAPGALAAAPARAGSEDLLVWMDLSRGAVLAVVPDGRSYLAGLSGT